MDFASSSQKHEVFLSFRGKDTRRGFTNHLYDLLRQKGVETYMDDRLKKGDKISDALIEAIRSSQISVIIFSANYATSSWCLDEVLCILECVKERGQVVIPVFYKVDPTNVRRQSGTYESAFDDLKSWGFHEEKVNQWRAALTQVANLSGWHSLDYRTDSDLINAIVDDIMTKMNVLTPSVDYPKGLVGMDKNIEEMKNLLCIDSPDVRIIGIWGMGGLGKTTLARAMFEQISSKFEASYFLENVREQSTTKGLDNLRKNLYGVLLDGRKLEEILPFHKKRLSRKKVLIVLDDVDQLGQLDGLAGDQDMFGDGSRVIVTTRDYDTIRNKADVEYQLKGLTNECSLELFKLKAFKRNYSPTIDDIKLLKQVVNYAKGIPLAVKVLGSFLCSQKRDNWKMLIDKLRDNPHEIIQRSLRISYDGLKKHEQRVFLDIVCFVDVGESTCRHFVERTVGGGRSLQLEIDHLIDKSLIFEEQGNLRMHDLVREMGWEIVRGQSEEIGERSRLWNAEDCYHVLQNNTELKNLKHVDLSESEMLTDVSALSMAPNLESVDLSYCLSLRKVPSLRFGDKSYHKCDYRRCSSLGYLNLGGIHNLEVLSIISGNVKRLNISFCNLEQLPSDLVTYISSLEELDLSNCRMLKHLPACIWDMESLKTLTFNGCGRLKIFQAGIFKLKSLTTLNLAACNMSEIPNEISCLSLLEKLDLAWNPIREIPEGIKQLSKLKKLLIENCHSLELLPEMPLSIELVNACKCTKLHTISDSRDTLKQEQLSDYHVTREWRFVYAGCSLNEDTCNMIVEEFQLRVLRLAAKIDSNNFKVEELGHPVIYICIPGYKIPEWFTHYLEASTLNVKLPLQWHNAAFLGFAICVEIERVREGFTVENLLCNLNFKMNNGEIRRFEWNYVETEDDYFMSLITRDSNMLMWYKYENYRDCRDAEEVSLNFTSFWAQEFGEEYEKDYEVRACGIRLLYRQEYEEKFEKLNVVSNKNEPPLKRLRSSTSQ